VRTRTTEGHTAPRAWPPSFLLFFGSSFQLCNLILTSHSLRFFPGELVAGRLPASPAPPYGWIPSTSPAASATSTPPSNPAFPSRRHSFLPPSRSSATAPRGFLQPRASTSPSSVAHLRRCPRDPLFSAETSASSPLPPVAPTDGSWLPVPAVGFAAVRHRDGRTELGHGESSDATLLGAAAFGASKEGRQLVAARSTRRSCQE
jgi:hypothetical protein